MNPDDMDWIAKLDYFDEFLAANFKEPQWKQITAGKFDADYFYMESADSPVMKVHIDMDCDTLKVKISKPRLSSP
jgi:hypothetical protein